jgi:nicotinamide-nucleotide amidase
MSPARPRRATILAVGTELLTPTRIDTNSLAITDALNGVGIDVVSKAIVGDDRAELGALVRHALARVDLLVVTGGLGPTDDDVTREVVATELGLALQEDPVIAETIRRRFESRGMRMPAINRRQAMVPRGASTLQNPHGTAPGLWIEHDGRLIVLLPGPPREMKPMLDEIVAGRLRRSSGGAVVKRKVVKIAGRTESRVEELTQPVYSGWRHAETPIDSTILASPGQIELHLSARGADERRLDAALGHAVAAIRGVLGADVFSDDGRSLEEVVGALLRERGWRVSVGESCTGGLATSRLTDVPGASDYVERGIVAYSNAAKRDLLGVPDALIAEHGAVSEPVAEAMATGARDRAGVEVGVGITGIAGPTGGSEAKPVGTVCIAVAAGGTVTRTFRFPGNRELVKAFASFTAIDMIRRLLEDAAPDADWLRR